MKSRKLSFKPVDSKQNFVEMEKKLLKFWIDAGIVEKYLNRHKKSKKKFSFLDGPITANNPMGVHHAWGRTYKDVWQRFFNMKGYAQRFQNGFDEQGLWVEVEVEKELGFKSKKDIEKYGIDKFVNKCKERVKKFSQIQTEQSKRLAYFMDWDNSYHTSSDENNYAIWNFLKVCNQKGYLYKGRDSVPWCPRCGTAISQHEILTEEYKEITHKTVVFKLPIKSKGWENTALLAWTTTPWTIPGNVALAVDPTRSYWKMTNDKGERIIIINPTESADLAKESILVNRLGLTKGWVKRPGGELKGRDIIGLEYIAPYDDLPYVKKAIGNYRHRVIGTDPKVLEIDPAEGTGIVHIAPGAGAEDFKLGEKEKLPTIEEIDELGTFTEGFDFLTGLSTKEASQKILNDLKRRHFDFAIADYKHRYPTCWRCKTELVWRVVDEWYIAMDRPWHKATDNEPSSKLSTKSKTLREQMIEVAKKIQWIPSFGLDRELDWLANMHDWLISKKRYWGLALPIWECLKCPNFEVIGSKEELKEKAVEGWDKFEGNSPHRPWIDEIKIKCSQCQSIISRIPDVGNPWLDAGIVPFSTMPESWFPADFITESFPGQFKNWFYSLIAMSTVLKNQIPTKTILGFAVLLDEKGYQMHKSKGNAIEFNEAADKIGVDVMRWMYTTQNPVNNLLFGYHSAHEVRRRFYLILWNCYKFFVDYASLTSWSVDNAPKNIDTKQTMLDAWIRIKLNQLAININKYLEKYDIGAASREVEDFVVNDLSAWYIRRSRNRVWPTADKNDQTIFLSTMYDALHILSRLMAPFTPFISEEIYQNLTGRQSVHLADYPLGDAKFHHQELIETMKKAREIVEKAHALRKEAQIKVRQPLALLEYPGDKLPEGIETLIADEVNVKKVLHTKTLRLDTKITAKLKVEGKAREIIRQIQKMRKEANCNLAESVTVKLPNWPEEFEEEIKRETLTSSLIKSSKLEIVRH